MPLNTDLPFGLLLWIFLMGLHISYELELIKFYLYHVLFKTESHFIALVFTV